MDVVSTVRIVRRGTAGARVWERDVWVFRHTFILMSCVHPVTVLNAAFCMTYCLFMLVKDAKGDHIEEAYYRVGLMTSLSGTMSISFYLPHTLRSDVCACTEMLRILRDVCEFWV